MDRLDCMRSFVRTVETGSFSAVARETATTQPTISKQIAWLERYLDVQLLSRSTRSLRLTEAGARFYEHCQEILESVSAAEASVSQRQNASGNLQVSCSEAFANYTLMPRLAGFLAQYPDITIDLRPADQFINLVEEGIDLAIRVGKFQDPALVHKLVGNSRRIAIATKSYLEQAGRPKTPQDLINHNCIVYSNLSTLNEWEFSAASKDGKRSPIVVKVNGRFHSSGSSTIRHAIEAGLGIGFVPCWLFGGVIPDDLQVILQDYQPEPIPIRAVYRRGRFVPGKVRCFIEFLTSEFQQNQMLCG
ncbi:LysR family transcriptional regulator [filamentous cyanobacterium LEGE 11480]|uniref:LysR family transcriptional regulator n=1 Tax=Romeriopsis navalis LEGE 11480 TaxID=2777977 RepID=A0A928VQ02_9CYAN|nr:LysR family transcriptional regulator [Romeriopsis navalis]MBE9030791.1 LysR family transcriptional regulator [Romeriopsis navalis LEGE 11480]